jgi:hypothetical protein
MSLILVELIKYQTKDSILPEQLKNLIRKITVRRTTILSCKTTSLLISLSFSTKFVFFRAYLAILF